MLQIHLHKAFFADDQFLDSLHKSFWNQTTLDLRKEKWTFLNREFPVVESRQQALRAYCPNIYFASTIYIHIARMSFFLHWVKMPHTNSKNEPCTLHSMAFFCLNRYIYEDWIGIIQESTFELKLPPISDLVTLPISINVQ